MLTCAPSTASDRSISLTRVSEQPRHYVSPYEQDAAPDARTYSRPWMALRPGESESSRLDRLHRTCFHCGREFGTVTDADTHEETCKT